VVFFGVLALIWSPQVAVVPPSFSLSVVRKTPPYPLICTPLSHTAANLLFFYTFPRLRRLPRFNQAPSGSTGALCSPFVSFLDPTVPASPFGFSDAAAFSESFYVRAVNLCSHTRFFPPPFYFHTHFIAWFASPVLEDLKPSSSLTTSPFHPRTMIPESFSVPVHFPSFFPFQSLCSLSCQRHF